MVTTKETVIASASQVSTSDWQPSIVRVVCGGLVGSLIGLAIYKGIYPIYTIPFEVSNVPSPVPAPALEKLEAYQYRVDCQNYSIVFGLTGLAVGIVCALAALKDQVKGVIFAGALGGILSGVGGMQAAMIVKTIRQTGAGDIVILGITFDSMTQSILAQAAIWGLMGLGVGAGIGIASGGTMAGIKIAIFGFVGGVFAAAAFIVLSAFAFPASSSSFVVPLAFMEQVIMMVIGGICIGGAIGVGLRKRAKIGSS